MVILPGKYKATALAIALGILLIGGFLFLTKYRKDASIPDESFAAPGRDYPSPKKAESYFIEYMNMSPEEAQKIRSRPGVDGKVNLRLTTNTTLDALVSNLHYYGFIRDEEAFRYALENSPDNTPGTENAFIVGNNSIDTNAEYRISEDMTAWELADELLNHPAHFPYDEYGYMFMP